MSPETLTSSRLEPFQQQIEACHFASRKPIARQIPTITASALSGSRGVACVREDTNAELARWFYAAWRFRPNPNSIRAFRYTTRHTWAPSAGLRCPRPPCPARVARRRAAGLPPASLRCAP